MEKFKLYLEMGTNNLYKAKNKKEVIDFANSKITPTIAPYFFDEIDFMEMEVILVSPNRKSFKKLQIDDEAYKELDKYVKDNKITRSEAIRKLLDND